MFGWRNAHLVVQLNSRCGLLNLLLSLSQTHPVKKQELWPTLRFNQPGRKRPQCLKAINHLSLRVQRECCSLWYAHSAFSASVKRYAKVWSQRGLLRHLIPSSKLACHKDLSQTNGHEQGTNIHTPRVPERTTRRGAVLQYAT